MVKLVGVREVADQLGVSGRVVYGLVAAGQLACHRIGVGRGRIRFSQQMIDDYVASTVVQPQATSDVRPKLAPISYQHLRFS